MVSYPFMVPDFTATPSRIVLVEFQTRANDERWNSTDFAVIFTTVEHYLMKVMVCEKIFDVRFFVILGCIQFQ